MHGKFSLPLISGLSIQDTGLLPLTHLYQMHVQLYKHIPLRSRRTSLNRRGSFNFRVVQQIGGDYASLVMPIIILTMEHQFPLR